MKTEKTTMQKFGFAGICLGIFAGAVILTYAIVSNIFTHTSDSKEITFTKGHTTEISFEVPTEGGLIAPGESKSIEATIRNGSETDSAYVFLELQENDVWELNTSWEKVEGSDGLYAYSSGGTMIPLGSGEELSFDGVVTLKASGADYQALQNDDLKITVTAYAVNTSASRDGVSDSWNDYEAGGNQEMIAGMEE